MSARRLFGTDGIRGRAGDGWLTPEKVALLGRAAGEVLGAGASGARVALLGHDGRHSGPGLLEGLAAGLTAAGFTVKSAGLITTPGIATLTRLKGYQLCAMVSASHNPAEDNGIKFFGASGGKLDDEDEDRIEARLRAGAADAVDLAPRAELDAELELDYMNYLVESCAGLHLDGWDVVLDCANGGGSRVAPRVLGRLGARVTAIASEPDGDNINQDCGSTHPGSLQEAVRRTEARLGIALDGDGDRCILVDEEGQLVHGDGILAVVARHLAQRDALGDPRIVATVMSNKGLHRALREAGVGVETVDVGDRRVVERLRQEGLRLGGEQSGHIVFGADNGYVGDGIYTALRVLAVMSEAAEPLSRLASVYQPFPQVLVNVPVREKPVLAEIPAIANSVRRLEEELGDEGRVLLRYSGTEPLARIMVEGPDPEWIQREAQALANLVAGTLGGKG